MLFFTIGAISVERWQFLNGSEKCLKYVGLERVKQGITLQSTKNIIHYDTPMITFFYFLQTSLTEEQKENLFQKVDKDGNGWISKRELRKYIKAANKELDEPEESLTNKNINKLFDAIDTDSNKKVTLEEFKLIEANIGKKRAFISITIACLFFCWG
jgi:hypothetical protein